MTTTWDSQDAAMGMRDVIAAIADKRINSLRPETSYAVVQEINREQRSARVLYMGDTDPVTVALGSIEPATVGQTVRIGGTLGHRYVEDVLGNAIMSGNDSRYAQTGHTHAGGGAVELEINDLSDVDTETNPPGASSVLGWNNVGGFWNPISIDLGTSYLALTGGTVTGPTTFSSSLSVGTTLSVSGAVTGQSFSGVGANLTSLNAAALASGLIPVARFPTTIGSNTTGTAAAWTTGRLLTMSGDVVGTVTVKGDADMTLSVALAPNSIALGTDTTGNYVRHIIGTANQIISDTVVENEGTVHTLSLPQSIGINSVPTFMRVNFGQATGTAPFTVTSTTMVANLTANWLGTVNQDAAFFQNAGNLNAGTVPSARLSGAYTGITGLGTLSTLAVTGVAALGNNSTVNGSTIWHAGNDGAGSGLDAGLLGGVLPLGYASTEIVESLMGDLLAVGLYDAAAYNGDKFTLKFDRPLMTAVSGLTIPLADHPTDISLALDLPVITQQDVAAGLYWQRVVRGAHWIDIFRFGDDDHLVRSIGRADTPFNSAELGTSFTIRLRVRKTTFNDGAYHWIIQHGFDSGTAQAWGLLMLNGTLILRLSPDGSSYADATVLTLAEFDAISGTANDTDFYVAVAVNLTGTVAEVRGWQSVNGTTWTTAGPLRTPAYAYTTIFNPPHPVNIGGNPPFAFDGRIYWIDVVAGANPNVPVTKAPILRFAAADHVWGDTATTYIDAVGRTWTMTASGSISQPYYQFLSYAVGNGELRANWSNAVAYTRNVGRPFHLHAVWSPTADTLTTGFRDGERLSLTATTPPWNDTSTAFPGNALTGSGPMDFGSETDGTNNRSYGGRMHRIRIVKNSVTLLDLENTNITTAGQMTITPTVGPTMTLSHSTMAMTTMPKPVWAEGPTVYRHNMYWIVASTGELDFIDSDLSGRYEVGIDNVVTVSNGDWIIAVDPLFGSPGHQEGDNVTLNDLIFQYIPFSTETYVKTEVAAHAGDHLDPHAAAGYLKTLVANSLFAPLVHTHGAEIESHIDIHKTESDPHPIYLTQGEADGLYVKPTDIRPYEPLGAVLAHEQKPDPHPQYVSHAEGNAAYSVVDHNHSEFAQAGHTHPTDFEVIATDGAQSARIFMGDDNPPGPRVGDLWIQTFDISLQPPLAPSNLVVSATAPTTITLTWNSWDPTVAQSGVQVERSPDGSTGWTNIFTDNTSPYAVTFTDTGRAERTTYFYRVRATNATGPGVWGTISAATTNAPPAAPGSLSVSNQSPTGFRFNWAAVTGPANDPLHATPYEVFRAGASQGYTASLFWDFGGLSENTSHNLGVRARDNLDVFSDVSAITGTTTNAAPPAPTGLAFHYSDHTQVHMNWTAVTGITDFYTYQVFLNGNYVANTTSTAFGFTGLSPSTGYTFGVRTVDTAIALSSISTLGGATSAAPDTTPPAPLAITSYHPEGAYGNMVVRWNQPEASYVRVHRNVNGTTWEVVYEGGLPAANNTHVVTLGQWGQDNTIYCVIHQWDAAGNVRYGDMVGYTLVASPTLFSPHASNSWRPTIGGQWGATGNAKLYQGFYDTPSLSSYGYWFYGSDFSDWWRGGRTITGARIFINREGCGNNVQDVIGLYVHDILENPGNVTGYGTPGIYGGHDAGTVAYNEGKWMGIPTEWMYECMSGARRGFAVARLATGKPYLCLHPAGTGFSGVVEVSHWG